MITDRFEYFGGTERSFTFSSICDLPFPRTAPCGSGAFHEDTSRPVPSLHSRGRLGRTQERFPICWPDILSLLGRSAARIRSSLSNRLTCLNSAMSRVSGSARKRAISCLEELVASRGVDLVGHQCLPSEDPSLSCHLPGNASARMDAPKPLRWGNTRGRFFGI